MCILSAHSPMYNCYNYFGYWEAYSAQYCPSQGLFILQCRSLSVLGPSPFLATTDDASSFDASQLSINRRRLFPIVHIQWSLLSLQKAVAVIVIVDLMHSITINCWDGSQLSLNIWANIPSPLLPHCNVQKRRAYFRELAILVGWHVPSANYLV